MNGYGPPPPQAPRGDRSLQIALRVFFAALPLVSCGLLCWVTMLRLASVTGRRLHWLLCALTTVLVAGCFGVLMTDSSEDLSATRSNVSIGVLLLAAVAVLAYYLYAEIAHFTDRIAPSPGYGPPAPPVQPGYGYPAWTKAPTVPASPLAAPPPLPPHQQYESHPPHQQYESQQPRQPHPSQQPQPHSGSSFGPADPFAPPASAASTPPDTRPRAEQPRIQQVRAELDDLSDILRNQREGQ
ncbi:hypothetical protein [Streptomyces sp. NPDC091212]|uniref:hypothetical protein n=1 Tax=Streptomyces sp. NPDC091212 TaxID=3155191 RepID=UPI00344962F5